MFNKVITLLFIVISFSCISQDKDIIICDAEETTLINNTLFFSSNGLVFEQANQQTNQCSFSGKYAVKVNQKMPFGFTHKLKNIDNTKGYKISVWRKGKGSIVVSAKGNPDFYYTENKIVQTKNDWELILCEFNLPDYIDANTLKVYVFNNEVEDCFFDDFKIEKLTNGIEYPKYELTSAIQLYIDSANLIQLNKKRDEAIQKGILITENDSWVKGKIIYQGVTNKIKLRLKGDWLDHLQNDKWSFRIKIKKGHVNNVREFSLQSPKSRDFLNEWVFHKLLHKEDILTTKYEFFPLVLNGKSLGLYAFEEHFSKELLEHKKRREAPILKFDETGFWNLQLYELNEQKEVHYIYPFFDASVILPFSKKSIKSDSVQHILFTEAQDKLREYKEFSVSISKYFDVEKWAKYYALVDVFKADHALVWHNQRFYYNPLSSKIEPVVYDAFVDGKEFELSQRPFLAFNLENYKTNYFGELNYIYQAFNDTVFRKEYFKQLNNYLNNYNWEEFYLLIESELKNNTELLQKEYLNVSFNRANFEAHIDTLKEKLNTFDYTNEQVKWFDYETYSEFKTAHKNDPNIPQLNFEKTPFKGIDLIAYTENTSKDKRTLSLYNYHFYPVKIIGFGKNKKRIDFNYSTTLEGYRDTVEINSQVIEVSDSLNYVFYQTTFSDSVYKTKVLKWEHPKKATSNLSYNYSIFEAIGGDTLLLKKGNYTLKQDIIIPAKKIVVIEAGTHLKLIKNTALVSYSAIQIKGTKSNPFIIQGEEGNFGFSLINVKGKSVFNHVIFNRLEPNTKSLYNTGGISVYKAEVEFLNCKFINSTSEDALNIVDAKFKIDSCYFDNCISDALDIDYGNGEVLNSTFNNVKNDGLDVSFSNIKVERCKYLSVGDKGISCGEKSKVKISNSSFVKVKIGIAVKDESIVEVNDIRIKNAQYGLVLFNKKETFKTSKASILKFSFKNVKTDFLIDKNNSLNKQGEILIGNTKLDVELFN